MPLPPGFELVNEPQPGLPPGFELVDPAQVPIGTTGQQDIGQLTAAGLGLVQGAGAGYAPQMAGLLAAAGTPFHAGMLTVPATALKGGAKLLYDYLTGGSPQATEAYGQTVDYIRDQTKTAQEQYPKTFLASEIGGAIASPASRAVPLARGAGWSGRALNAGANATIYGGVQGSSEGDTLEERARNAAIGSAIGGVTGLVASPVADVVGKGVGIVGRGVASPFSNLAALRNPDKSAAATVAGAVRQAETTGDRTALSRAQYDRLEAAGEPVATIDLAGDAGRNLARRVRNEPSAFQGRQAVQDLTNERYLGQGGRYADDIERLAVGNRRIDTEDLRAAASPINNVNYRAAHQEAEQAIRGAIDQGATRPLLTDRFKTLLQSPIAQEALAPAAKREANRTIVEGEQRARKFPLVVKKTDAGNVTVELRQSQSGKSQSVFDLHAIDSISRALRDFSGSAERSGNRELSRDVTILRKAWLEEADRLIPAYAKARGEAFKRFKAEDAFEAGQNFVKRVGKMGDREFSLAQKELAGWNQTERELFKRGGGQELAQWLRSIPENQDVVPKILNSSAARKQMEMILGEPAVRRIQARHDVEKIMEFSHKAVSGNSTTAFQLALERGGNSALAGAGLGGGYALLSGDNPFTSGAIASGLLAGNKRITLAVNAKVLDKVGKLLVGSPAQYEQAMQTIIRNEKLYNAIRQFAHNLERSGAGAAGGEAAPQIAPRVPLMIGRATEEDQPIR